MLYIPTYLLLKLQASSYMTSQSIYHPEGFSIQFSNKNEKKNTSKTLEIRRKHSNFLTSLSLAVDRRLSDPLINRALQTPRYSLHVIVWICIRRHRKKNRKWKRTTLIFLSFVFLGLGRTNPIIQECQPHNNAFGTMNHLSTITQSFSSSSSWHHVSIFEFFARINQ